MKAVLVIDMPEHCYECPLVKYKHCSANYFVKRNHGEDVPYNFSDEYTHNQGRQAWCPLKPLPKRRLVLEHIKNGSILNAKSVYEADGYNACLDEIAGENE